MLINANELAEYLGISYRSVTALARESDIPHLKIRGKYRFIRELVDEWLINKSKVKATAPERSNLWTIK